ncbi:hypothetical protein [Candidatus Ichthyocystis sparus]|nr:hypothetical protein [Candidatus Ichthyocystis sparus]
MINSPASSSPGNESETSMEEGEVSSLQGMELAGGASFEIPTTSNPSTSTPSTSTPSTSTPSTSTPITSTPSTSNPSTSNPSTSTPSTSTPIDLLSIIERNKRKRYAEDDFNISKMSPSYHNPDFTLTHKKWRSVINDKFRLLNDELLSDFAEKLEKFPIGSSEEKQLFFSKVSGSLGTHPFAEIRTIVDVHIGNHIESEVFNHAMEKTGYHTGNGACNYADLKGIIAAKLEEMTRDNVILTRMRAYVRRKFNNFLKEKYQRFIDREFSQNTDIKIDTLSKFSSLYNDHLKENIGRVTYESVRAFDNIVATGDENLLSLSFIFTSLLGTMVFYDKAEELSDLITTRKNKLVHALKKLLSKEPSVATEKIEFPAGDGVLSEVELGTEIEIFNEDRSAYSVKLKELMKNSQAYLKAEIETYLQMNKVIALHGATNEIVVLCGSQLTPREQEVKDTIISSSLRYLRGELNECIKVD